jgi:hypothetical protein
MRDGIAELAKARSGEVFVVFGPGYAAVPADPRVRVDPGVLNERSWLVTAAAVGALVTAGAGELAAADGGHTVLLGPGCDPELAALGFEEYAARLDRVRPRAVVVPDELAIDGLPILNPELRFAQLIARQGGNPADAEAIEMLEESLPVPRPHEDPDPGRRAARRILQRLNGMGKWGGYHTAFDHLARGFAGNERQLAYEAGEALLAAGMLEQKPSVGQRHVFLNPRRAADIHRMIDTGEVPPDLRLPA